jgi:hypothetical protein
MVPCCLSDLRNTCMLFIAFYGFLRYDELVHLQRNSVIIHASHAELKITKSKCDQLRFGSTVVIARLESYCPVRLLEKYLLDSAELSEGNFFLFRRVVFKNKKEIHHREQLSVEVL